MSPVKLASSMVVLSGKSVSSPAFNKAVKEIAKKGYIEPYFFQEGRFERVAGKGYSIYALEYDNGKPNVNSFHVPEDKLAREISIFVNEPGDDLLLIDGGSYEGETLTSLDQYERTFVLFPPYNPMQTVHITEAKRQLWKNVFTARQGLGVDRVRY